MATGRSNKLVGQTGEYLVAAELSRRGLIATTFTGNVPHYDIIASDEAGRHVSVQVKTVRGGTWQLNISHFCEITFNGHEQIIGTPRPCPVKRLVMAFVSLEETGNDRFYICNWEKVRDILIVDYAAYLGRKDGVRPQKWDSLHTAISEEKLLKFRDKWETVQRNLR